MTPPCFTWSGFRLMYFPLFCLRCVSFYDLLILLETRLATPCPHPSACSASEYMRYNVLYYHIIYDNVIRYHPLLYDIIRYDIIRYTVGFHNFNLRIFNLRVSNPIKLIVDVFLTRCRISMCQGLGPKKHDEISEIDRNTRAGATPGEKERGRAPALRRAIFVLRSRRSKNPPNRT